MHNNRKGLTIDQNLFYLFLTLFLIQKAIFLKGKKKFRNTFGSYNNKNWNCKQ